MVAEGQTAIIRLQRPARAEVTGERDQECVPVTVPATANHRPRRLILPQARLLTALTHRKTTLKVQDTTSPHLRRHHMKRQHSSTTHLMRPALMEADIPVAIKDKVAMETTTGMTAMTGMIVTTMAEVPHIALMGRGSDPTALTL